MKIHYWMCWEAWGGRLCGTKGSRYIADTKEERDGLGITCKKCLAKMFVKSKPRKNK